MSIRSRNLLLLGSFLLLSACTTTEQLRDRYANQSGVKAFALASNGVSGAAWQQSNYRQAIQLAMYHCRRSGGADCRVVDLDGSAYKPIPSGYHFRPEAKREHVCPNLTLGQAYKYLMEGHYYLDRDGDGHPCEWGPVVSRWSPTPAYSSGSNCHWVKGYTRKDGTRVSGHRRCR